MNLILGICENPGILRALYFGILIRDIIFTLIPIGLIVMLLFDFSKAVIAGKEEEQIKNVKNVPKRIMYAVIVFLVPWIVGAIMNILSSLKVNIGEDYTNCIKIASTGDFSMYDKIEEEKLKREEEEFQKYLDSLRIDNQNSYLSYNANLYGGNKADNLADEMIRIAYSQLGNSNNNGTYGPKGQPWCAYFTTWVMENTIINNSNLYKEIISSQKKPGSRGACGTIMYHFDTTSNLKAYYSRYYAKKIPSRSSDANYIPKKGDLIFFMWKSNWNGKLYSGAYLDHIGIVERVENGKIYTIEGNCSNQVKQLSYSIDDTRIVGYGSWYDESGTDYLNNNINTNDSNYTVLSTDNLETAKKSLEDYVSGKDYNISIGYYDLTTGYTYTYNPNYDYYGASTIKTLDILYYYNNGKPSNMSTSDLEKAIRVSHNEAHKRNIRAVGLENYRNYGISIGVNPNIMSTVYDEDNKFGQTNVATQFIYLKELYKIIKNIDNDTAPRSYFINPTYNCLEYNNSPTTMHKYGSGRDGKSFHDVGIVLDGDTPYIVVILTEGQKSGAACGENGGKTSESNITKISKLVYQLHKSVQKNKRKVSNNVDKYQTNIDEIN